MVSIKHGSFFVPKPRSEGTVDVGDAVVGLGRKRSTDVVLINQGTDGL